MAHGSNWRTFPGYLPNWLVRVMDAVVHAITVETVLHRLTHDGMVFSSTGKNTGLANAGVADFLFVTGDLPVHLNKATLFPGDGDVDFVAYENTVTSNDGGAVPVLNVNRDSSNLPKVKLYGAPAVTSVGDLIHTTWAVPTASSGANQQGVMNVSQGEEWVMSPNTKYLFRITNNSGGTISYAWDIVMLEPSYVDE